MIKEAIEKILELHRPEIVQYKDRTFSTRVLHGITDPEPSPLRLCTLSGLVDWFDANMDIDMTECMIHIVDYNQVKFRSPLIETWQQRFTYIDCKCVDRFNNQFGVFQSIEKFIIWLHVNFADNPTKAKLTEYLSNIRGELVSTSVDDGISQEVAIADKVGRLTEVQIEPIIKLKPFRTFAEIEQPESPFLLRLQSNKGDLPTVALFNADAGAWKLEAIKRIADYLKKQKVIKENEINIIA